MTIKGSCHCGAVRVVVPALPGLGSDVSQTSSARPWIGCCNCSICVKLGWLVGYYPDDGSVRVTGATATYIHGDRMIAFHHCPTCGCGTHWTSTGESYGRIGLNARLLDGFAVREGEGGTMDYTIAGEAVAVRFLDNAG